MEGLEQIIGKHPFFKGMSAAHIKLLSGCAKNVRFKKTAFIFREGEQANTFYCIRAGCVALEFHTPNKGATRFDYRKAGDVPGWSWLVAPHRWYSDACAVDDVRALAFDGACLRGKWEDDSELGYQMYKRFVPLICRSLQATRLQLIDMYGAD